MIGLTRKGTRVAAKVNALVSEIEDEIDRRVSKTELRGFGKVMVAIDAATAVDVRRR